VRLSGSASSTAVIFVLTDGSKYRSAISPTYLANAEDFITTSHKGRCG
jgi:hypothetical protein